MAWISSVLFEPARLKNTLAVRCSSSPARSRATMVFSNVGSAGLAAISSISARSAASPASSAGLKCPSLIRSKGGRAYGSSLGWANGLSGEIIEETPGGLHNAVPPAYVGFPQHGHGLAGCAAYGGVAASLLLLVRLRLRRDDPGQVAAEVVDPQYERPYLGVADHRDRRRVDHDPLEGVEVLAERVRE